MTSYRRSPDHWDAKRHGHERDNGTVDAIGRGVRELAESVGEMQRSIVVGALEGLGIKHLPRPSLAYASACGIRDHHCPSPDLGEIRKITDRREAVKLAFRVRNTSRSRRTFALSVKPIATAAGKAGGKIALSAASVTLDPNETTVVRVNVDARAHDEGIDYDSVITIAAQGCETMYLRVAVLVRHEPEQVPVIDLHCGCTPRPRRQHWSDHYYCDPVRADQPGTPGMAAANQAPSGVKLPAN